METSNPLLKREGAFAQAWTQAEPMTLQGAINKTGILLLLCVGAAGFSWTHPELRGPLVLVGLLGGLIACLVGTFKPAAPRSQRRSTLCLKGSRWEPSPKCSNSELQASS